MKSGIEIEKFSEAVRIIIKDFHAHARKTLMKKGLTLAQFHILSLLADEKMLKMSALKEHLSVTGAAATKITDTLVRKNFVKRGRWGMDRREVLVSMTSRGKSLMKALDTDKKKFFSLLLNNISKRDKNMFMRIVKKMSDSIVEQQVL